MLIDPARQASFAVAEAIDRGSPLDGDAAAPIAGHATFDQFLQALNPLHHIPVVGIVYRAVTGAEIHPTFQILGGAMFGGVGGILTSAAMVAVQEAGFWKDLRSVLRGEDVREDSPPQQLQAAFGGNSSSA